jgi:DNA helicase II / ATP-dependent DNA helicase PcrA
MIKLNEDQQRAVEFEGNIVITACPGSGKTRVLTARVMRGLAAVQSRRERVVALTFTNRAADEIQTRLDDENIPTECLWAGTIHAFALDWILRPYAPYSEVTRYGFTVADEYHTDRVINELKRAHRLDKFAKISTTLARDGRHFNHGPAECAVFEAYKDQLRTAKLIDYDDVLFLAYDVLQTHPEVAGNLSAIIRLVCVDEVQDIQDLQFGILATIFKAGAPPPMLFFVGDSNQSIYESLGALTKTPDEIAAEFSLGHLEHRELKGNYRSTQRLIDFYSQFRPHQSKITSLAEYAQEAGVIAFANQTIEREDLTRQTASIVKATIASGIAPANICVLAPQWRLVQPLARSLIRELPSVDFDAPGLSPLHSLRDNAWFKISRLFLTQPHPSRTRTRLRWANEVLADFALVGDRTPSEKWRTARRLLRIINSIASQEADGIRYLQDVFLQFLRILDIDLEASKALNEALKTFVAKIQDRIADPESDMPTDVAGFRKLFSHPCGVVVNTCHGVKG